MRGKVDAYEQWQKDTKLNIRPVYYSQLLYGKSIITAQQLVFIRIVVSIGLW
jgi:hypothetical protein